MRVNIDTHSGFCFGVVYAIEVAERELLENHTLYCLGDIVHNTRELERLTAMGLVIITPAEFRELRDCKVMIRAHGEPPETYATALRNRIELIDASCPIVLTLQNAVLRGYKEMKEKNGLVLIYGKEGHAEVNALVGQTENTAIVVADAEDLSKIDFTRSVRLFSQTTKSLDGFNLLVKVIWDRMKEATPGGVFDFEWNDSICRQVSNRAEQLKEFVKHQEVVIFVSGLKSSNGKILYQVCKEINPLSYFVTGSDDLDASWFKDIETVGVCGATSTPGWLMEEVAAGIRNMGQ